MRLSNSTTIPNATVKAVIRAVRPSWIANFDVMLRNKKSGRSIVAGMAYTEGSAYHATPQPFIVCRVAPEGYYPALITPYQYGQHKGLNGKRTRWVRDRVDALAYILAHELRHLWQAGKPTRGYCWGSRGQFSEVDTEAFALKMLRKWRNANPTPMKPGRRLP